MKALQSLARFALIATTATFVAAPSMARANTPPVAAENKPLSRAIVSQIVAAAVVELREAYVFPEKGVQAANELERSLAAGAYADADPVRFAQQVTDQLRATTGDSHMRLIFGSPFANQPPPAAPQDAGFEIG